MQVNTPLSIRKAPSERTSSICPELWEILRYHSYKREQLEKTPSEETRQTEITISILFKNKKKSIFPFKS